MIKDYLMDKKILVLGLGISNVEIINCLDKLEIDFDIVNDSYDTDYKVHSTSEYFALNQVPDIILKAPGIFYDHPILETFDQAKVINDIELAYQIAKGRGIKIIGVTGTNGKTSTTIFITRLLNHNKYKAFSCGNIGTSILAVLHQEEIIDFLVVELSSFQLKAIDEFRCDYAFFLNISPDHLDYHKTIDDYFDSKLNIIKNRPVSGYFFINEEIEFFADDLTLLKNDFDLDKLKELDLGGVNPENVKLVYQFCKVVGIDPNSIVTLFGDDYKPLAHRLEFVSEVNGVRYFNDSKATNVQATQNALSQLDNVILLVGGYDKGEDMTKLADSLCNVKQVIAYGDNQSSFDFINSLIKCETLEDALSIANTIACANDTILLSPASASYDQFRNFEQRGDLFKRLVSEVQV